MNGIKISQKVDFLKCNEYYRGNESHQGLLKYKDGGSKLSAKITAAISVASNREQQSNFFINLTASH